MMTIRDDGDALMMAMRMILWLISQDWRLYNDYIIIMNVE